MIILVTGGARSGKSSFAENLYKNENDVVYIATSKIFDKEMENRVEAHRKQRPITWRTFEANYNLDKAVEKEDFYLLDCITLLSSNIMYDITKDLEDIDFSTQEKVEKRITNELDKLINKIRRENKNLILVTNELGMSIVPENKLARIYRDVQGRINQKVAKESDQVYLVVCGLPVRVK